jgi:hypothetical protein
MRTFETDIAAILDEEEPVLVGRLYNNEMLAEEELAEVDEYFNRQIDLYCRDIDLENEDC